MPRPLDIPEDGFRILDVFGSPFPSLPPFAGSQVWFIAQKVPKS